MITFLSNMKKQQGTRMIKQPSQFQSKLSCSAMPIMNTMTQSLIQSMGRIFMGGLLLSFSGMASAQTVVTYQCGGTNFNFIEEESFVDQATPILPMFDNSVNGDGCGADVFEGNTPTTSFINYGRELIVNQGFGPQSLAATFGSGGNAGLINVPGPDFVIFEHQFSVDDVQLTVEAADGTIFGPVTFGAATSLLCDADGDGAEGGDSSVFTVNAAGPDASACAIGPSIFIDLAAYPIDVTDLGVPNDVVIVGFTVSSFEEADLTMAGILQDALVADITEATLTLEKVVINDDAGGTSVDTDFTLIATGPIDTISGIEGDPAITEVSVEPGTYDLTESGPGGYALTLACTGAADTDPTDGLDLVAAEVVVCTYTNNDVFTTASLTLEKTVINDNGGGAADTDFTLTATGPTTITGVENDPAITSASVDAGNYILTESAVAGYNQTNLACTGAADGDPSDGLDVVAGETIICTFTNDDAAEADLSMVKTFITAPPYNSGDTVSYNLAVTNNGPASATNVLVDDSGTLFTVTGVSGGGCTLPLPCNIGTLINGANVNITVTGTIDAIAAGPASFTNTATASSDEADLAPGNSTSVITEQACGVGEFQNRASVSFALDGNAANNETMVCAAITASANLGITKTLNTPAPYQATQVISYTIVVSNVGPDTATNVVVADTPTNLSNLTIVSSTGNVCTAFPCTIPSIASGSPANDVTITVQAEIAAAGLFDNVVTAFGTQIDPDEGDNTDNSNNGGSASAPSLSVVKTQTSANNPVSDPGDLDYEIVVTNTGVGNLTGVVVDDTLPDGNTGTVGAPTESITTDGILEPNETFTYTTSYTVTQPDIDAGAILINTASVTTAELPTPSPAMTDTAETSITQNATMTVNKVVDVAEISAPTTLNYTITLLNTGNVSLTGVAPTDSLPDNTTGTLSGPTETGGSGTNGDGILDVGESWEYTTSYDADQNDINTGTALTNAISVVTTEITTPEEDTAVTNITQVASIRVTKNRTGITGVGGDGDTVTYDIIVENTGSTTVLDIEVTDPDAVVTGSPIDLNIGESVTLTAVQTIDATDVANGFVQNSATATGDSSPTSTDNVIDVSDAGVDADGVVIPDNENVETGPPNGNSTDDPTITTLGVALQARVMLQGALNVPGGYTFTTIMRDALRQADQAPTATTNFLPDTEPYTNLGFTHVGDGGGETVVNPATVFADNGNDSIVDWVFVELRDASDNTAVIATRAGLVQRDGDVVDVDGVSPLVFSSTAAADYFVSINHRNHLGVMTEATSALSSIPTVVDFTDPGIALFHLTASNDGLEQFQVPNESLQALWAGDVALDNTVVFAGQDDDSSSLFDNVVLDPGNVFNSTTFPLRGYHQSDVNMNSVGVYAGQNNDIDFVFANTDLHPNNIFSSTTFTITEQLP